MKREGLEQSFKDYGLTNMVAVDFKNNPLDEIFKWSKDYCLYEYYYDDDINFNNWLEITMDGIWGNTLKTTETYIRETFHRLTHNKSDKDLESRIYLGSLEGCLCIYIYLRDIYYKCDYLLGFSKNKEYFTI